MANFAAVAHLDTFELAGSLRTRLGLFKPAGLITTGWWRLQVRGSKTGAEGEFVRYKPVSNWAELTNLRNDIQRRAETLMPPGIEFGRIFFEMLDPGAVVAERGEVEPYFLEWTRTILPLRTNPGLTLLYGNETASPGAGWLTAVNPRLPHAAINMGDASAVWLVLDFRRKVADG